MLLLTFLKFQHQIFFFSFGQRINFLCRRFWLTHACGVCHNYAVCTRVCRRSLEQTAVQMKRGAISVTLRDESAWPQRQGQTVCYLWQKGKSITIIWEVGLNFNKSFQSCGPTLIKSTTLCLLPHLSFSVQTRSRLREPSQRHWMSLVLLQSESSKNCAL